MSEFLSLIIGSLPEIIKITLGGVVASVITLVVTGKREKASIERLARNLATKLIELLERFASDCVNVRTKHEINPPS